jgi:hypothetical protein
MIMKRVYTSIYDEYFNILKKYEWLYYTDVRNSKRGRWLYLKIYKLRNWKLCSIW